MSRRNFKAFDQRTGRLERAIQLVEDGQTGVLVKRGTQDRRHPLDRPVAPPLDRAALKAPKPEIQRGTTTIYIGYTDVLPGSNYERPGISALSIATTGGTFSYFTVGGGYGFGGYGEYAYGGAIASTVDGSF